MPLQVSQAPKGELKENIRGSSSEREILQLGQENFSEKRCSASPALSITSPSERERACSTEFRSRDRISLLKTSFLRSLSLRESSSIKASMVCLLVLMMAKSPPSSISFPSIRAFW